MYRKIIFHRFTYFNSKHNSIYDSWQFLCLHETLWNLNLWNFVLSARTIRILVDACTIYTAAGAEYLNKYNLYV